MVYGSGLAWGRLHNRENLPVLLAGGGGGTIHGGRHVHYSGRAAGRSVPVPVAARSASRRDRFADSTGPLPQLSGPSPA